MHCNEHEVGFLQGTLGNMAGEPHCGMSLFSTAVRSLNVFFGKPGPWFED